MKQYSVTIINRCRLLAIAGALFLVPSAHAQERPPAQEKPLEIVASFSILADFARRVGGTRVRVTAIVGPGADAHTYRATPQDVKLIGAARMILVNGLGFEPFMERAIRAGARATPVVVATRGFAPLSIGNAHGHSHGKTSTPAVDPHAWQSLDAARHYVLAIRDGLIAGDSAGKAVYEANAAAYLAELTALKAEITALFAPIPQARRVIVTSHASLAYFAREFDLTVEAIQGLSTEAEPNARDVARILTAIRDKKASAVFLEAMSSPRLAMQIAGESGARLGGTLFSDALSDDKGLAPTYIAMMRHNARMIAAALVR